MALPFHRGVSVDDVKTVRTAGGTVILPIGRNAATSTAGGVSTALAAILTGNSRARQALKAGLVDDGAANHFYWKRLSSWLKRTPGAATLPVRERIRLAALGRARC